MNHAMSAQMFLSLAGKAALLTQKRVLVAVGSQVFLHGGGLRKTTLAYGTVVVLK